MNAAAAMNATQTVIMTTTNLLEELKLYAKEHNVPIMMEDGIDFLLDLIREYKPNTMLEIGTAIGYSSINFASLGVNVTTIERDDNMYALAINNINKANLNDKIRVIKGDAKETFELVSDIKYDMIFIDAAKGSYQTFFDLYSPLLADNGIIVCDNMDFHGLCEEKDLSNYSRGLRSMIRKLNAFKENLLNNPTYETKYYHIGDGITVSKRVD